MVFLSICTALYDYVPQGDGELPIHEGEIVYILEKSSEDEWWKAKKKAPGEAEEEPVGLIPNNYVEETQPIHRAKALYDYSRQTDEELSFSEDAVLLVYDTSDPDWTLVGLDGEFGFAPANYIEIIAEADQSPPSPSPVVSPPLPERHLEHELPPTPTSDVSSSRDPAAALAGILHEQNTVAPSEIPGSPQSNPGLPPRRPQYTPDASDEESPPPALPQRPRSQQSSPPPAQSPPAQHSQPAGVVASPPYNRANQRHEDGGYPSPGGFHLYNVNEMVSAMGKQKKMPTTLGINIATGKILIAPEKSRDGPEQEWTAEKLTHYSLEGKHVFMELVRPSRSIDFHAGAKDTANEIVSALGDLAGAARAEGLREVMAASAGSRGTTRRKGHVLYEFMAQGSDEVTVAVGDEVIILDDSNEEWWKVRRVKNGSEGVVPGSYVEATGLVSPPPVSSSGLNAGRSTVEQNRLEEQRQTKQIIKSAQKSGANESKGSEVGPGVKLPTRGSSLTAGDDNNKTSQQRTKRDGRSDAKSSTATSSKPKPDGTKTRTWTDRSGSFKVEAEFIGLKDGKIHLHKLNGVKIAVPVVKMAIEDLEYVERVTGVSLDEDKPLSDIRRRSQLSKDKSKAASSAPSGASTGASIIGQPKKPEYDWFDFFLKCGVSPSQCERYNSNFIRDSMDETVLPDITPQVLNTLGLKQGDILRVMKFLDNKFGRTGAKSKLRNVSFGGEEVIKSDEDDNGGLTSPGGGLFSGPGGSLKNNTRKGRPAPTVQTNNTVDPEAFLQKSTTNGIKSEMRTASAGSSASSPSAAHKASGGFDDDAWDVKPSKQQPTFTSPLSVSTPISVPPPSNPHQPALTGAMAELSLLDQPLQPVLAHSTGQPSQKQPVPQPQQQPNPQQQVAQLHSQQQPSKGAPQQLLQHQHQGASPSFFASLGPQGNLAHNYTPQPPPMQALNPQTTGIAQLQHYTSQPLAIQHFNPQAPNLRQQQFQLDPAPRQRPQAPQFTPQGTLMPPPPPRPLSAPQNMSPQNNFGPPPLQPQLTGVPNQGGFQTPMASPGQTLNELNKLRLQQQFAQQQHMQPQPTGFNQQSQPGYNQYANGFTQQQPNIYGQQQLLPQITGVQPSPQFMNGQKPGSPFADPRSTPTGSFQPLSASITGFSPSLYSPMMPQQTGSINSVLPPALQPQATGVNGFNSQGFSQAHPPPMPPMPPMPQQQVPAPLQPQKTGPAPAVRFGVAPEVKKLMPQPTGRKANLSQATPQNPFGFE